MSTRSSTVGRSRGSSSARELLTAEDLANLPDRGKRYELVDGVLQMMALGGFEHGRIALRIGSLLDQHVRKNSLGSVCGAETGFIISRNPDTVRAPDVAFVSTATLATINDPTGFLEVAPTLVAEVVSPNDRFSDVEEKARLWLRSGVQMVQVVDPQPRVVHVYRTMRSCDLLGERDVLDAGEVVPDWKVAVAEFFA